MCARSIKRGCVAYTSKTKGMRKLYNTKKNLFNNYTESVMFVQLGAQVLKSIIHTISLWVVYLAWCPSTGRQATDTSPVLIVQLLHTSRVQRAALSLSIKLNLLIQFRIPNDKLRAKRFLRVFNIRRWTEKVNQMQIPRKIVSLKPAICVWMNGHDHFSLYAEASNNKKGEFNRNYEY